MVVTVRNGPNISHLFFVNDNILFCRAKCKECNKVLDYEQASSKVVNIDKSCILFNANMSIVDIDIAMINTLNIHRSMKNDSYMGLPLLIERSRSREFRSIKERIWSHIQSWGGRLLSSARKAIMLQVVAHVIHLYVMRCFRLPKGFIHDLCRFLVG